MKQLRSVLLTLAAALLLTAVAWAADFDGYIVRTKKAAPVKGAALMDAQPENTLYLVDTLEEAEAIAAHTEVEYICPNYYMELQETAPNDPYYDNQWTLPAIHWQAAYDAGLDGSGVTVAVIDSGIRQEHEDFSGLTLSKYSKNFADDYPENNLNDKVWHGTFVASQIAATTNNATGIAGIAGGVELMILRCFKSMTVDTYSILPAIQYAVDHGADIINLSFGDTNANNTALETAIQNALDRGVIVVAAAGNYGNTHNDPMYPASYDGVISVASVSKNGTDYIHSPTSEYNDMVDIAAPGGSVYGIHINNITGYGTGSGTSFSTPVVSAVAALMKEKDPAMTSDSFYGLLAANAQDLGDPGKDPFFGFGLVDIEAMLQDMGDGHYPYDRTVVPATCTAGGTVTYRSRKDPTFALTYTTPALGHDTTTSDFENSLMPTCTTPGYHQVHCARCGEEQRIEFAQPLGHKPILSEENGVVRYACDRCQEHYVTFDLQALSNVTVDFGSLADFQVILAAFDGQRFLGSHYLMADAELDLSPWRGDTIRAFLLNADLSPVHKPLELYTPQK